MVNYLKIGFAAAGPLKNDARAVPRGSRRRYGNPRLKTAASSAASLRIPFEPSSAPPTRTRRLSQKRGPGRHFPVPLRDVPVPAATARSVPITMQDALLVLHLHSGEDTCKHFPGKRSTQQEIVGTRNTLFINMLALGRFHFNGKVTLRTGERHGRAEDRTADCVGSRKVGVKLRLDRCGEREVPQK